MIRAWILPVIAAFGFAGSASAETWTTNSKLMVDQSARTCSEVREFQWKMEFNDNKLTGYNKVGTLFSTTAAADGTVKVDFRLAGQIGLVSVYGNAKTRDLEHFNGNQYVNCRFKLVPNIGYAQASSVPPVEAAPRQSSNPTVIPPTSASSTIVPMPTPPTEEEEARQKFVASLRTDDVLRIQNALSLQGLYRMAIDGVWGPSTDAAIRAWQARSGIQTTGFLSSIQVDTLVKSAAATELQTPIPGAKRTAPVDPAPAQSTATVTGQPAVDRSERERQLPDHEKQVSEQKAEKEQTEREQQIAERERLLVERERALAEQKTAKVQADRERQIAEQKTAQQHADEKARWKIAAERIEKDRQLAEQEKQLAERERRLEAQERLLKLPTATTPPPSNAAQTWLRCAVENGVCDAAYGARVRFGLPGQWVYRTSTGEIACSNQAFGADPAPGRGKVCEVDRPNQRETRSALAQPDQNALMRNAETKAAQGSLKTLGFYNGPVDGVYGPTTAQAIKAWQASSGSPQTGMLSGDQFSLLVKQGLSTDADQKAKKSKARLEAELTEANDVALREHPTTQEQAKLAKQLEDFLQNTPLYCDRSQNCIERAYSDRIRWLKAIAKMSRLPEFDPTAPASLAATAPSNPIGQYANEYGEMSLESGPNGWTGTIDTWMGPRNSTSCHIEGNLKVSGSSGYVLQPNLQGDKSCQLRLLAVQSGFRLSDEGGACRSFCGANAGFDGWVLHKLDKVRSGPSQQPAVPFRWTSGMGQGTVVASVQNDSGSSIQFTCTMQGSVAKAGPGLWVFLKTAPLRGESRVQFVIDGKNYPVTLTNESIHPERIADLNAIAQIADALINSTQSSFTVEVPARGSTSSFSLSNVRDTLKRQDGKTLADCPAGASPPTAQAASSVNAPPAASRKAPEWQDVKGDLGPLAGIWVPEEAYPAGCAPSSAWIAASDLAMKVEPKAILRYEWVCTVQSVAKSLDGSLRVGTRCGFGGESENGLMGLSLNGAKLTLQEKGVSEVYLKCQR